jgi:hypothetical protein
MSYTVTVAMPPAWNSLVVNNPTIWTGVSLETDLGITMSQSASPAGSPRVWTGSGTVAALPDGTDAVPKVYLNVIRSTGGGSMTLDMNPALMLIMLNITDANGNTRRIQGSVVTLPLRQGSIAAVTCSTPLWNWTAAQLVAVGWMGMTLML